jgi:hypothetical protein
MSQSFSNSLPFEADPIQWDDIRCPVSALAPGATPADPIVYGPGGAVRIRGFDGAATLESMDFTVQIPHGYKEGSNISPHVHWCPSTNNGGNVIWHLDYYWVERNGTIPALTQVDTGALAAGGVAWKHLRNDFPVINGSPGGVPFHVSSMLMCRIWRDPTGADTYPDDAGLLEVDFHYEIDSVGSRTENAK